MSIDLGMLDKLVNKFELSSNGKWYARTYSGSTIVYEDEITGYTYGPVPGELNDIYATQRAAVLLGGRQVVSTTDPVTGGIGNIESAGKSIVAAALAKNTAVLALETACTQSGAISSGTWVHAFTVPFDFDAVSIGIVSDDAAGTGTGVKACVASSETTDAYGCEYPIVSGVRDDTKWAAVTWGGSATGTVAQAAASGNPSITWSDFIPLASMARTDGFDNSIFLCRVYIPAVFAATGYETGFSAKSTRIAAIGGGEFAEFMYQAGDKVTTPSTWTQNQAVGNANLSLVFRFRMRQGGHSVAVFGDSTYQGYNATGRLSWGERAARGMDGKLLQKAAFRSGGWSGQTVAQALARLKTALVSEKPTAIIFQSASPNDAVGAYTTASLQADRAYVLEAIELAQNTGIRLIVASPMPYSNNALNASNQNAYLAHYAWVMALNNPAALVHSLDFSSLHDPASPGKWAAGLSTDGLHPNDAGAAASGSLAEAKLAYCLP